MTAFNKLFASRWLPILIAVGFVPASLLLWYALSVQERVQIEDTIAAQASHIRNEMDARMDARILALVRMGKRWEYEGKPAQDQWEFETKLLIQHYDGFAAIEWVDPDSIVRWVVPLDNNEQALGLNLAQESRRRAAMQEARDKRDITFTRSIDLVIGGRGFLAYVPIFRGEHFGGFILGVFRFSTLLKAIVEQNGNATGFGVTVLEGEEEIYRRANTTNERQWQQEIPINFYGISWRLQVWPEPPLLNQMSSPLPFIALVGSLVMTFMLAFTVYLAQTARLRAQQVSERTDQLQQALNRAERADRAKTLMLSNVTHEMRTPLSSIIGFSNLLLQRTIDPPKAQEYVSLINSEGKRLNRLINDFLDLQRLETGRETFHYTSLNLARLVENIVSTHPLKAINDHPLQLELSPVRLVYADENRIRQVILNLLSNAEKYSPGGGAITISLAEAENQVVFSIRDEGLGILPDEFPQLFDHFYRGEAAEYHRISGTGLGLAICRSIIEAHQGRLWAESAGPNQGATFRFALPVVQW